MYGQIGFMLSPIGLRLNQLYRMIPAQAQVRAQHGIIDEGFVVADGGNIGMAAGVETLLEACRSLQNSAAVYCLVAGSGQQLGGMPSHSGEYRFTMDQVSLTVAG